MIISSYYVGRVLYIIRTYFVLCTRARYIIIIIATVSNVRRTYTHRVIIIDKCVHGAQYITQRCPVCVHTCCRVIPIPRLCLHHVSSQWFMTNAHYVPVLTILWVFDFNWPRSDVRNGRPARHPHVSPRLENEIVKKRKSSARPVMKSRKVYYETKLMHTYRRIEYSWWYSCIYFTRGV